MIGGLINTVGGHLKSDQKAVDIIAKARQAIGGDAALAEVRSMVIVGRTSHTVKFEGTERIEGGETEIAMQLPDKLSRKVKIGNAESATGERHIMKTHDVVIVRKGDGETVDLVGRDGEFTTRDGKTIILRDTTSPDGSAQAGQPKRVIVKRENGEFTTEDGKKVIVRTTPGGGYVTWTRDGDPQIEQVIVRGGEPGGPHAGVRQNELLRTTLMLLLTAPEGIDVSYTFAGEGNIDGNAVNIVAASFAGSTFRLHIDKFTNLPVAIGYTGRQMPQIVRFKKDAGDGADAAAKATIFTKKMDAETGQADLLVKLSDFRGTGSVQLPYRWTTTSNGQTNEVLDVTSYELNPENIADRFSKQAVTIRFPKVPAVPELK